MKTKKRAIYVEESKLADAKLKLTNEGFKVWSDVNVFKFDPTTSIITSAGWVLIIVLVAILN
jgi:hypothetical protein